MQEDSLASLERLAAKPKEATGGDAVPADKPPTKPSRGRAEKPAASSRMKARTSTASLERQLKELFTTVGGIVVMFDDVCGPVVIDNSERLAAAWAKAAEQNPRLKKMLESLLSGGAYGEVVIVTFMTLLPIFVHHGLVPPGLFGTAQEEEYADANADGSEAIPA